MTYSDQTLLMICEQVVPDVHRLELNIDRLRHEYPGIKDYESIYELARLAYHRGTNKDLRAVALRNLLKETYGHADASSGAHPDQGT